MPPGCQRIRIHVDSVLRNIPAAEFGQIPNQCGAYVIHTGSGRRNVGSSNAVRSRVQAHKGALDPTLRELQADLGRRIRTEVGGKEVVRRSWITYQVSPMKNFCPVKVLADCLQVDLKVGKTFQDPGGVSKKLARTQAWIFDRRLTIKTPADLDAAIPLIAQAFRAQGG